MSRCSKRLWITIAFATLSATAATAQVAVLDPARSRVDRPAPQPPEIITVDNAKQLFADDWVVAEMSGLTRTLHPLQKHPDNPLLRAELPWEKPCVLLYGSVMYDPDRQDDRFRMWYLCYTPKHSDDYAEELDKSGRIAYAVSRDGLNWQRPSLGLHEFEGNKENNIVIPGPWGVGSIHYDPRDPDPARRYKAQARSNGHRAYFSPDGIHWTEQGVMDLSAFDRTTVHWHPLDRTWFASTKNWYKLPGREDQRGRGYAESTDFLHWGDVSYMCATEYESGEIVYGLEPFFYETTFFGQWDRYRHEPDGLLDVQLAVSRNGRHWERPSEDAWIPLSPLPEDFERRQTKLSPETGVDPFDPRVPWDYANNSGSILGPVRVNDELWMYYSGRSTDHRSQPHVGAIGLGTLRLDGFYSLDAGERAGMLLTRPLRLAGDTLRINANAEGGELRVEVVDEAGEPISPFTSKNCAPINTDGLRHVVQWKGADDLTSLAGKTVRLKFLLQQAELYAFWTGEERRWHSPDTSTWVRPDGRLAQ